MMGFYRLLLPRREGVDGASRLSGTGHVHANVTMCLVVAEGATALKVTALTQASEGDIWARVASFCIPGTDEIAAEDNRICHVL